MPIVQQSSQIIIRKLFNTILHVWCNILTLALPLPPKNKKQATNDSHTMWQPAIGHEMRSRCENDVSPVWVYSLGHTSGWMALVELGPRLWVTAQDGWMTERSREKFAWLDVIVSQGCACVCVHACVCACVCENPFQSPMGIGWAVFTALAHWRCHNSQWCYCGEVGDDE